MVPLSKKYFMIGLILQLDFPVIIVTSSALGTINHTLLTIEALRSRGAKIAGVIMNGETNKSNKLAIEEYGRVKILFEFAPLSIVSTYELEKRKVNDELVNLFKEGL